MRELMEAERALGQAQARVMELGVLLREVEAVRDRSLWAVQFLRGKRDGAAEAGAEAKTKAGTEAGTNDPTTTQ